MKIIYLYCLFLNDVVVYCGITENLDKRINKHKNNKEKLFDSFSFIKMNNSEICDMLEKVMINILNPIYNKTGRLEVSKFMNPMTNNKLFESYSQSNILDSEHRIPLSVIDSDMSF